MQSQKYKFDWYQTGTEVIISISKRGVSSSDCQAFFDNETNNLNVLWKDEKIFSANLYQPINQITINCTLSKVEVHLEKHVDERWPDISATNVENLTSSSSRQNEWDRLAREAEKEEEEDSDATGVDKLFQKIYRDADDDVKKAMMKSFSESCGTVLSTNWNDIKKKKTEIKPPDSMEFKKYET